MSGWVVQTLVATTALMLVVLALRPLVRHVFGAGAAYALWLVPVLRLVLPPLAGPAVITPNVSRPIEIVMAAAEPASGAGGWLLAAWALGALLFMGWHIANYRRFVRRALRDASPCGGPGAGPGISAVMTDAVAGPAAIGLITRLTLLPRDFYTRFDPVERELALRHERVHHARGDLWANAGALGMLGLHWFNPIAHVAYRAFRQDQELSCDAAVIAGARPDVRASYGSAMVKSAWAAAPVTTCPMTRTSNLKRRLKMVRTHRKSTLASAGGMAATGLIAVAGLTLTASGGFAAQPVAKPVTIEPVVGSEKIVVKPLPGESLETALGKIVSKKCGDGTRFETPAAESGTNVKPGEARIVFCAPPGTSAPGLANLEKARANIASSSKFAPAERAKVLAALDNAIAKAKAQ